VHDWLFCLVVLAKLMIEAVMSSDVICRLAENARNDNLTYEYTRLPHEGFLSAFSR